MDTCAGRGVPDLGSRASSYRARVVARDQIVAEIKRLATELGRAPGKQLFANETGIREHDWAGKYWARWTDALAEAGLSGNALQGKMDDTVLAVMLADEIRRLGRFPTSRDLMMRAREQPGFPSATTFQARGGKAGMVAMVRAYCEAQPSDWADVLGLLPGATATEPRLATTREPEVVLGYVYLVKSGSRYKIGMSTDVQRRLLQLNTGMPDAGELIHVINTDDPAGIEAYWHRRFADRRVRPDAEWFALIPEDVRAFRRRRFQ
jgi:Meiotically up-regulated gene 113/Homing endonuclease associated repeat